MNDGEVLAKLRSEQLSTRLQLVSHPEGGSYARFYTADANVFAGARSRPAGTAVWYLLSSGQCSLWHVVDADEIWHHVEGETLGVLIYDPNTRILERHRLGSFDDSATPVLVVPRGCWQAVIEVGEYALCTCVVAPGFEYQGYALVRDLNAPGVHFENALYDWKHLL